jgi:hypothetical protein
MGRAPARNAPLSVSEPPRDRHPAGGIAAYRGSRAVITVVHESAARSLVSVFGLSYVGRVSATSFACRDQRATGPATADTLMAPHNGRVTTGV